VVGDLSRTREIFVRQQRTLPGATRAICHQFSGLFSEPHVQQLTCRKAIKIAHEIPAPHVGVARGFGDQDWNQKKIFVAEDGGGWKPWSESSRVQFEGVGSWVLGIWKGDKSETAPGAPEDRVHRRTVVVGGPGRARDIVVLLLVFLALENRDLEVRA